MSDFTDIIFSQGAAFDYTGKEIRPEILVYRLSCPPDADIVIKDAKLPFPKNGDGKEYFYKGVPIEEISSYDPKTGIWSGFTKFSFDEYSGSLIASVYDHAVCQDENTREYLAIE